ncbi:MAG: hypothetical protein AAF413_02095 [Patescibacteria group bacterium]
MRTRILYRSNTESEPAVVEFVKSLDRSDRDRVELVDVNSRDGDGLARLYGIQKYPSVIVTAVDGTLVRSWFGGLPLVSDFTYYLHQN